jgi:hypothetical protein
VVSAGKLAASSAVEGDAVGEARRCRCVARVGDRGRIEIHPPDGGSRVGACERDRRPTHATAEVQDAWGGCGPQRAIDVRQLGEPRGELRVERRPVQPADPVAEPVAVVGVGDALTRPVGVCHASHQSPQFSGHVEHRTEVRAAVRLEQYSGHGGRELEQALVGRDRRIDADEVAGDGLLLEPLTCVSRRDAGIRGQAPRR